VVGEEPTNVTHAGAIVRRHQPQALRLPSVLAARSVSVPILMYHRIDLLRPTLPAITRSLTVDPNDFAAQMRWLHSHGFHTISQRQLFDALERGDKLPTKPIMLTFDDGYRDVFGKAMPILIRLNMRATAYVITSRISGPDPSFLTWGRLRALEHHDFDIGSHTVHHLELTMLPNAEALRELTQSRRALEQHLGHPVQWFAYPAGAFNARAAALVREAGYVLAVTTQPGALQNARMPLELHRFEILDSTGVAGLRAILSG
jgi:peptidoglycan/xylan/chitin deacetylase (PgdA/CDA1 family)